MRTFKRILAGLSLLLRAQQRHIVAVLGLLALLIVAVDAPAVLVAALRTPSAASLLAAGAGGGGNVALAERTPRARPTPYPTASVPPFTVVHLMTVPTATPMPPPPPIPTFATTLFLGDSLTAGYYATDLAHGYAALVASTVQTHVVSIQGIYGVTAASTYQAMQQKGPPPAAALAIVELGTNDQEDPTTFSQYYAGILAEVRTTSPRARLLCLGPWQGGNYGGVDYTGTNLAVQTDCQQAGGAFINLMPLFNIASYRGPVGQPTALGPNDGFHPNNAGHAAIAQAVFRALRYG